MLITLLLLISATLAAAAEDWKNPKDKLLNPRGQVVCMQQCGTRELLCPEAFFKEQNGPCYRCCSTWGETVIRVECKDRPLNHDSKSNGTISRAGNATSSSIGSVVSHGASNLTEVHTTNRP